MRISIALSVLIGMLVGAMAFPMIIIPVTGIGVVIAAYYLLFHDVIWPSLHSHNHKHHHSH